MRRKTIIVTFSLAGLLLVFLAGALSQRAGYLHDIKALIISPKVDAKLRWGLKSLRRVGESLPPGYGSRPDDMDYPCMTQKFEGICPSTSMFSLPLYDFELDKDVLANGLPKLPTIDTGYRELLADAVGFDSLSPAKGVNGSQVSRGQSQPYRGGTIAELRIGFTHPRLNMRALYAEHGKGGGQDIQDIIVILHGLGSSADKVMGLDHEDYLRRLGQYYFDRGMDVLAFNITTGAGNGSLLTSRLRMYGTTRHGLSARTVCDAARDLDLRKRYRRVILYGLSNGAYVSLIVAALCEPFSLVIADDGGGTWRPAMWSDPQNILTDIKYPMFILYRRPVHEETSLNNQFYHTRSPLIIVRPEAVFDSWRDQLAEAFSLKPGVDASQKINFVFKSKELHVPEIEEILDPLLFGKSEKLKGYSLIPRPTD